MTIQVKFSFLLSGLLAVVGCKPASQANLKTLDQFAGGAGAYQCKGDFKDNTEYMKLVRGVNSDAQKRAVESALSAVPSDLKDAIFLGAIDTSIELTSDISSKCESSVILKANAKTKSVIFACPVIENGVAKIYVDSNPAKIQSSLVRALAYYLIEIIGKIDIDLSTSAKVVVGFAKQDDIKQSKKLLGALEFLDDVATISKGDLSIFGNLLPPAVTTAKDKDSRNEAFFDPARTNVGVREAFASYILAEMLDSSLCSDQSRQVLITQFPKTFKFFAGGSPGELSLAAESGALDTAFSLSGSSTGAGTSGPTSASPQRASSSVTKRTSSDPIPSGLKDSGKKIYMVQSDGSEVPTTLYYVGNSNSKEPRQQAWRGKDGIWRQSDVTTVNNGEKSVGKVLEAPDEWHQPPAPARQKNPDERFNNDLKNDAMKQLREKLEQKYGSESSRNPRLPKVEVDDAPKDHLGNPVRPVEKNPRQNSLKKAVEPAAEEMVNAALPQGRALGYFRQGERERERLRQEAAKNASGGSTSPSQSGAQQSAVSGSQQPSTFCRWLPFFCSSSGGSSSGSGGGGAW